jgi:hypothetical protein
MSSNFPLSHSRPALRAIDTLRSRLHGDVLLPEDEADAAAGVIWNGAERRRGMDGENGRGRGGTTGGGRRRGRSPR